MTNELTALSQFDMILSYMPRHVPIHRVFASVAFMQAVSDSRADRAIPQGVQMSVTVANAAAIYKIRFMHKSVRMYFTGLH